jgi:hypothetical protein
LARGAFFGHGNSWWISWDLMVIYGDLMGFNGDLW